MKIILGIRSARLIYLANNQNLINIELWINGNITEGIVPSPKVR